MNSIINITSNTTIAPIRPYPNSEIIPTELYKTLIQSGNNSMDFYEFQGRGGSLSENIKELDIHFEGKSLGLPEKIRKAFLKYLQSPKYGQDFDCHNFIDEIYKKGSNKYAIISNTYNKKNDNTGGDIGYIHNKLDIMVHGHIYLGEGLFLGKGGKKGPITISTNEAMEKLRGGKYTLMEKYI